MSIRLLFLLGLIAGAAVHGFFAAPAAEAWGCVCITEYRPVCGVDGRTYGNSCEARCRGVQVARGGACGVVYRTQPRVFKPRRQPIFAW